jgi:electron transport complex protein RnfD
MRWVILASLPALAFLTYWQGLGFLVNLGVAVASGILFEVILKRPFLDGSAIVTALLFAAGVPAFASPWVLVVGMFFAIVVAKHLYGGLGHNLFNPAMVAYAVVLIAFPAEMVVWPAWSLDSLTGATPLDHAKPAWIDLDLLPSLLTNGCWLVGGLVLFSKGIIRWQIPLALLLSMLIGSLFFPHALLQWGLGSTMIAAFFIATDPVTAPALPRMKLIYGALIGLMIVAMRQFSSYPDGVAFAVLFANAFTPLMDHLSIRTST